MRTDRSLELAVAYTHTATLAKPTSTPHKMGKPGNCVNFLRGLIVPLANRNVNRNMLVVKSKDS